MDLFNVGILELLVIGGLALVLFGPDRLVGLLGSVRKAATEFQRQASDLAASAVEEAQSRKQGAGGHEDERAQFTQEAETQDQRREGR